LEVLAMLANNQGEIGRPEGQHGTVQYDEFDSARFVAPAADWQAPYSYRTGNILIERPAEAMDRLNHRLARSLGNAGGKGMQNMPSWRQLSRGMPVQFRDGNVGTIEHILVDSYHGGIGEIVVRLAAPPHSEISVPLDLVSIIEDVGIFVDRDSIQVELLSAAP